MTYKNVLGRNCCCLCFLLPLLPSVLYAAKGYDYDEFFQMLRKWLFALVGLVVSRSHIASSVSGILGDHVSIAGSFIPALHQGVTLHSIPSFSESLHCFPAPPRLYIVSFYSRSMFLEHGSSSALGRLLHMPPQASMCASPGAGTAQSQISTFEAIQTFRVRGED